VATDAELLASWAGGDRDAGRGFYERYADRVTRFFARKIADDVVDLVQRTFLKCLEAARKTAVDNPGALLFAIARNELYDAFRAKLGDRRFDPEYTSLVEVGTGPATGLARREQHELLQQALARLPLDAQIALELYYWDDLAMDDVAAVLGISTSAAINRIHRARQLLREQLPGRDDIAQGFESRRETN
jgi:RNA polymerase sigma factor (sigma-70 family)